MKLKRKLILIVTVLSAVIFLIHTVIKFFLHLYLTNKFDSDFSDASSIGIIGGADGPVSIIVANAQFSCLFGLLPVIAAAGGIYLYLTRKKG